MNSSPPEKDSDKAAASTLFQTHRHDWNDFLYVYPVVSRRSRGVSIGINLNPDKKCNFDCVYCQIDRSIPPRVQDVNLERLEFELHTTLEAYSSGNLFKEEAFKNTPTELRRLNDIAFSGEGEPTSAPCFLETVLKVIEIKKELAGPLVKLVLITNAGGLDRANVRTSLTALMANQGEIWAKLDAGTEAYYRKINRSHVAFDRILQNIEQTAQRHPIYISSLFLKLKDESPPLAEIDAYCRHLIDWRSKGVRIVRVQAYTIARPPAESWVQPLSADKLGEIVAYIQAMTDIPVDCFPGV